MSHIQNLGLKAILSCSRVSALAASAHGKDATLYVLGKAGDAVFLPTLSRGSCM